MIGLLLLVLFVGTVMTGPAGREWRAARAARRDLAAARLLQLPAGTCRTTVYQARSRKKCPARE